MTTYDASSLLAVARDTLAGIPTGESSLGRRVSAASDIAWVHRFDPWPARPAQIRDEALKLGHDDSTQRFAYWCAGRRLHYAFAHALLADFCSTVLSWGESDPFLEILGCAGAVASGETSRWHELADLAHDRDGNLGGKALHVLLTTAFVSLHVPDDILRDAVQRAQVAADSGDVVAAYRVASLLRRAGDLEGAYVAVENACALLVTPTVPAALADHLSERLLAERQLVISLRRR